MAVSRGNGLLYLGVWLARVSPAVTGTARSRAFGQKEVNDAFNEVH